MEFNEETYNQIDDYLRGVMGKNDILLFEEKMKSNDLLKKEVAINKLLKSAISNDIEREINPDIYEKEEVSKIKLYRNSSEFIEAKKTIEESAKQYFERTDPKQKTIKNKLVYYASIVAAVLLIFLTIRFTGNQEPQNLYNDYKDWDALPSLIVQGHTNLLLSKGELLFEDQKYDDAISIFIQFLEQQKNLGNFKTHPYVVSYTGISHLELGNYQEALKYFDQLEQSSTIDYSRAYWYKALLYIKKSNTPKAKEQLMLILKDEKNYNYSKAKKVLKKLLSKNGL
ncbi:hypothetical protein A8C32_15010 [Flavivirga aquatica]|uniref:Uncharacterized protein n=1 Tax=Flavivirga aquatica TaxID=1849968 RepID=A0A1E5T8S7_9FLAO|nr:tetratricopeptide repeat protein [Flavivirga aquatica]OEK07795.1 hypothetical protein A8C32_15010 [Flavivirga aquatica]